MFFFFPVWIPGNLLYYIYYGFLSATALLIIINLGKYSGNKFTAPFLLLIIAILLSILSSRISWSQGLVASFVVALRPLAYIIFFLLIIFKLKVEDIEKVLIILGISYSVVYLTIYFTYPMPTFSHGRADYGYSRGLLRIMIYGTMYMYTMGFYSINKYINTRKIGWLILYLSSGILIIMTLTRLVIVVFFALSAWYLLRKSNYFYKIIAVLFIVVFVISLSKMKFSSLMFQETVTQLSDFRNYVRVQAADFYLHDFSPTLLAKIIGNGTPKSGSPYWRVVWEMEWEHGFYLSDIGYAGLYVKYGVLAVIAFIILIYLTFKISVPEEYLYGKFSLYLILILSIMGDVPYYNGAGPVIPLLTYVLYSKDLSKTSANTT